MNLFLNGIYFRFSLWHFIYSFNKDVSALYLAAERNNTEIMDLLFTQENVKIEKNCFIGCIKLKQIRIPSYMKIVHLKIVHH